MNAKETHVAPSMKFPPLVPQPVRPHKAASKKRKHKQLSFADIANGFLSGTPVPSDKQGTDPVSFWRSGDETIRPDAEDWKVLSYIQKFFNHMTSSLKADHDIFEFLDTFEDCIPVHILLVLDQKGNVCHGSIATPSCNKLLDELMLRGCVQASPYPPIPKHFEAIMVPIPFTLQVQGHARQARIAKRFDRYR
jgi:hypothetical protein